MNNKYNISQLERDKVRYIRDVINVQPNSIKSWEKLYKIFQDEYKINLENEMNTFIKNNIKIKKNIDIKIIDYCLFIGYGNKLYSVFKKNFKEENKLYIEKGRKVRKGVKNRSFFHDINKVIKKSRIERYINRDTYIIGDKLFY